MSLFPRAKLQLSLFAVLAAGTSLASAQPPPNPGDVLLLADARTLDPRLVAAMDEVSVFTRREAVLALARLETLGAVALLTRALTDTDATVRRHASLGMGLLGARLPGSAAEALHRAAENEPDFVVRAAMLRDAGRRSLEDGQQALVVSRTHAQPFVRAAGCQALAGSAAASPFTAEAREAFTAGLQDRDRDVRSACAFAASRMDPRVLESVVVEPYLARLAAHPAPAVRLMTARALGKTGPLDALERLTGDRSWRVAVHAIRSFATRQAPDFARALTAHLPRTLAVRPFEGPPVHRALAWLDAAKGFATSPGLGAQAEDLLALANALPASRDAALVQCALARLADAHEGTPQRIRTCGSTFVTEEERALLEAEVLGLLPVRSAADTQRLEDLFTGGNARVREAVLAVTFADSPLIERALLSGDVGVVTAALEVLANWPADKTAPPTLARALERALRDLAPSDEPEALVGWMTAAKALALPRFAQRLRSLHRHPAFAVRAKAHELLALPGEPPAVRPRNVLTTVEAWSEATLVTSRGTIRIRLHSSETPATVHRFAELAQAHFYDGLTFHRVVPGFVIQGGDPRGDGYGGPGWTQRCEYTPATYRRGSVGMALAGRDTGGSQFFITQSSQPHLDGRYTQFGEVIEGLDVVDRIQQGDRIEGITVSPAARGDL